MFAKLISMQNKRSAIVTGGAQGIGRVIADTLLGKGWQVMVWDYDGEALEEEAVRHEGQPDWNCKQCDVADESQVIGAIQQVSFLWGNLDLLVNNAAIHANSPVHELPVHDFRRVIDVNLTGIFICSKYCAPLLRESKGTIINLASTRAFQSEPNTEAYSASKGGVVSLTHALALSLGPDIRVNSISPGWIEVSSLRKSALADQVQLTEADHVQHPAGRVGDAADIASMVLFLSDPANSFITGQNFIIDGGMTRKMVYVE